MLKNEIPGLCEDGGDNPVISLDPHIKDLIYKLAETSSNFCEKNNLDKDHMILFIQLFFNMMKISNEDVLDFKEKFGLLDDSSDDDEYDDDDYDDEDDDDDDFDDGGGLSISALEAELLPALCALPGVAGGLGEVLRQYALTWVAFLVVAPAGWWLLARSSFGLAIRAVGENPEAADAAGIDVGRTRTFALMLGGALMAVGLLRKLR